MCARAQYPGNNNPLKFCNPKHILVLVLVLVHVHVHVCTCTSTCTCTCTHTSGCSPPRAGRNHGFKLNSEEDARAKVRNPFTSPHTPTPSPHNTRGPHTIGSETRAVSAWGGNPAPLKPSTPYRRVWARENPPEAGLGTHVNEWLPEAGRTEYPKNNSDNPKNNSDNPKNNSDNQRINPSRNKIKNKENIYKCHECSDINLVLTSQDHTFLTAASADTLDHNSTFKPARIFFFGPVILPLGTRDMISAQMSTIPSDEVTVPSSPTDSLSSPSPSLPLFLPP